MRTCVFVLLCLLAACTKTPTTPSVWTPNQVRDELLASNLNHTTTGNRGRLTRWRVPIEVNTNGIARAEVALTRYETWSGGVIRFTRVSGTPANGLVFVEGGATASDSAAGCVNVTDVPPPESSNAFTLRWDAASAIVGTYTIHLGSDSCDDVTEGRYREAYAEHILAHALGVFDHFVGFTGVEGMADAHAFAVVYNLYANPVGALGSDVVIWPASVR